MVEERGEKTNNDLQNVLTYSSDCKYLRQEKLNTMEHFRYNNRHLFIFGVLNASLELILVIATI